MNPLLASFLVIAAFTVIGGVFAAAEIALVTLRESQINAMVEQGRRGSERLARLVSDPNRFLATLQVGVTLAGFVSAGYGASKVVPEIAPTLEKWGVPAADTVAFIISTVVIAYLSLVFGELVPKRLGLQKAETVALRTAGIMDVLSVLFRPFVALLSISTNAVVRLFGLDPHGSREAISGAELRDLVAAQESLSPEERRLIDEVFAAGEREVVEVMVPRTEAEFLDGSLTLARAVKQVENLPYSRYPVVDGSPDDVIGIVHLRDLLNPSMDGNLVRVRDIMRPALMLPESRRVIPALQDMRAARTHLAIVADEYGGTAGVVAMEDLLEELVGEIEDEYDEAEAAPGEPSGVAGGSARVRAVAGPAIVTGLANRDDFRDETGLLLPDGPFDTVGGFIATRLGRLPVEGDAVSLHGRRITVTELDGRRVAHVFVEGPTGSQPAEGDLQE